MKNTTQIGNELRDHVIDLLEAEGHKVEREIRLNTKKIDVLLTLDDEFRPRTIAIECKNESRSLAQRQAATIYADHASLIEKGDIDELWIVVRTDSSPEAKGWAREQHDVELFSIAEFEENRNGFRRFVRQQKRMFEEDDLDEYYIQQKCSEGPALDEVVTKWVNSASLQPAAILGGYGTGKTSYCRFLVSKMADEYLADPLRRVPIYIRLADISKEQDLEGLIAKTLTDRYGVKNYNFSKFMHLNEKGRFLLIFDGFDEMKFALSWSDFKYNFAQINRTVRGHAKVIIAGRPNAFLSDFEHAWILRGVASGGERPRKLEDWPEFKELEIRFFSDEEAYQFLRLYLTNRFRKQLGVEILDDGTVAKIEKRVDDFKQLRQRSEMLRPVHMKIFSDVAARDDIQLRNFSVYELYTIATTRISEREGQKSERAPLDPSKRQSIIEEVAWWLWEQSQGRSLSFQPQQVPFSLIRTHFPLDTNPADDSLYREVFSSYFIDRKHGENYYFPHRSFIEFFVSNKLAKSRESGFSLELISRNINPEILTWCAPHLAGQSAGGFKH